MTPAQQRRLLNKRDDLPPSVSAELASLTAIQTFLLETGERRAAAKLADEWLRRFETFSPEPTPGPAQPEVPLEVAPPHGVVTRRTTPDGRIKEVIIETPEPGAIAAAVRAFLRARLAQR